MSKTVITDPNGDKTTIQTQGCGNGCTWFFALALLVGSIMQMPILLIPTIAIAVGVLYLKEKNK